MTSPLFDEFANYLRMERGLAENTVASYLFDLAQFSNWLKMPLEKAKRENVQTFLAETLKGGTDARSVTRKTFTLRRFYCFLLDEGRIRKDPTLGIPLPKRETKCGTRFPGLK